MTIVDQVKAFTRTIVQSIVDKESLNYQEAAGLYGIILQARHNISMLSLLYNQAQDAELKELTREAIEQLTVPLIEKSEELMRAGSAESPNITFPKHSLYDKVDFPKGVRLTDMEIAIALGNLAKAIQLSLFMTLQQTYQLEVAATLLNLLRSGMEWNYRLLQLTIHRGWLPKVSKVEH